MFENFLSIDFLRFQYQNNNGYRKQVTKHHSEEILSCFDYLKIFDVLLKITVKNDVFIFPVKLQTIIVFISMSSIKQVKQKSLNQTINLPEKVNLNQKFEFKKLLQQKRLIDEIHFLILVLTLCIFTQNIEKLTN